MAKNLRSDKKDESKILYQPADLSLWQQAHIEKGVEAARKGDFASDRETSDFFKKYGRCLD